MPRKKKGLPSELTAPAEPILGEVPSIIAEQGRVAGFEHVRDRLLSDFEIFVARGVNPYSTLKLIIEFDRHALFSEIQQRKQQGQHDVGLWQQFQDYLHGEVDVDPPVSTTSADALEAEGFSADGDDNGESLEEE